MVALTFLASLAEEKELSENSLKKPAESQFEFGVVWLWHITL